MGYLDFISTQTREAKPNQSACGFARETLTPRIRVYPVAKGPDAFPFPGPNGAASDWCLNRLFNDSERKLIAGDSGLQVTAADLDQFIGVVWGLPTHTTVESSKSGRRPNERDIGITLPADCSVGFQGGGERYCDHLVYAITRSSNALCRFR
jgi:hypothetical protein